MVVYFVYAEWENKNVAHRANDDIIELIMLYGDFMPSKRNKDEYELYNF